MPSDCQGGRGDLIAVILAKMRGFRVTADFEACKIDFHYIGIEAGQRGGTDTLAEVGERLVVVSRKDMERTGSRVMVLEIEAIETTNRVYLETMLSWSPSRNRNGGRET